MVESRYGENVSVENKTSCHPERRSLPPLSEKLSILHYLVSQDSAILKLKLHFTIPISQQNNYNQGR
jgi:hypothetical protein